MSFLKVVPKKTAPVTFGFSRQKGRYFRVAVTFGWLKNVCTCSNSRFRQSGCVRNEIKRAIYACFQLHLDYPHKQSRLHKQKRPQTGWFCRENRKYNGRIISQCNWLPRRTSFDSAARQTQFINHSLKKNSVKFEKKITDSFSSQGSVLKSGCSISMTRAWEQRLSLLVTSSKAATFVWAAIFGGDHYFPAGFNRKGKNYFQELLLSEFYGIRKQEI